MILLAALAFGLAAGVGVTELADSYVLALLVSVALCPALLGHVGGRWLSLGAAQTLIAINFLPVLVALDQRFHLGEPTDVGWLVVSFVFAWAGWRFGRRAGTDKIPGRNSRETP
jgi:hypothetical protein